MSLPVPTRLRPPSTRVTDGIRHIPTPSHHASSDPLKRVATHVCRSLFRRKTYQVASEPNVSTSGIQSAADERSSTAADIAKGSAQSGQMPSSRTSDSMSGLSGPRQLRPVSFQTHRPVGCVQSHVSTIETQADVRFYSGALEDMLGEPHDWRRASDAQPLAVAAKPHLPGWSRQSTGGWSCRAHIPCSLLSPPQIALAPI